MEFDGDKKDVVDNLIEHSLNEFDTHFSISILESTEYEQITFLQT